MNGESANKFISALVKSLQTLCHGYVEFNDGIEIIGHLYLNIDSGSSFDYVVKEKVCKNAENSTVFVSRSFQAQAPLEESITRKDRDDDPATVFEDSSNMSPTAGTSRLQSAITSISNVLSGTSQESHKARLLDHSSHHPSPENTVKRKREHNGNYNNMQPPYKYLTLQTSSSSSSSSYLNSGPPSKPAADRNHSEHFNSQSHAEFFGGDSNQSSGMGPDDEDDLDLDVTFVKEEYESQRNSGQRGVSAGAASRLSQDPSSSQSNILHDGTPVSGPLGYHSHHQVTQFAGGTPGDVASLSQSFQDSSQVELGQHPAQGPPNPRSEENPISRQLDTECDSSPSQQLKLEGITGISDTLQLGIKLFGPKFVADISSGDIDLPTSSSDLLHENDADMTESSNASVFPDMFDKTTIIASSLTPGHKLLWPNRKDKMKRSSSMMKASHAKLHGKAVGKKLLDVDVFSHQSLVNKSVKSLKDNSGTLDSVSLPFRRKRGRPPKRLKYVGYCEHQIMNIDQIDQCKIESLGEIGETENEGKQGKELGSVKSNSYKSEASLHETCPVRPVSRNDGYSRRIRGSYRQYTAADKLEIIDFGIKFGSTAASRKYSIPESTVRSWTKKMDTFIMQMNACNLSTSENEPVASLVVKLDCATSADSKQNLSQSIEKDTVAEAAAASIDKNSGAPISTVD